MSRCCACALTAAGLGLAAGAGRPALAVAAPLAAAVWAYDLGVKHTHAGPVALRAALATTYAATAYAATAGRPYTHAALNPSPPRTQRAVVGGIRATIPLQAALADRAGSGLTAVAIAALAPIGRKYLKKVSVT